MTDLIAVGLLLDIVGAVSLAIPDIPSDRLRRHTGFGRLEEALRLLQTTGTLRDGQTGFEDFHGLLSKPKYFPPPTEEEMERLSKGGDGVFPSLLHPPLEDGPKGFALREGAHPLDDGIVPFDQNGDDRSDLPTFPWGYVQHVTQKDINRSERWYRFFGVVLLVVGFLLQLLGTVF